MRKVIPLATIEDAPTETSNSSDFDELSGNLVTEQKIRNEKLEKKRHADFTNILCNEANNNSSYSQLAGFYGFGGVVLGTMIGSMIALIPIHDVIQNPDYFYEGVLIDNLLTLYVGIDILFFASYVMKINCIRTFSKWAKYTFGMVAYRLCFEALLNYYWVVILENRYPMPFHTQLVAFTSIPVQFILVWNLIPEEWKQLQGFRKRFGFYMLRYVLWILMYIEQQIFAKIKYDCCCVTIVED